MEPHFSERISVLTVGSFSFFETTVSTNSILIRFKKWTEVRILNETYAEAAVLARMSYQASLRMQVIPVMNCKKADDSLVYYVPTLLHT